MKTSTDDAMSERGPVSRGGRWTSPLEAEMVSSSAVSTPHGRVEELVLARLRGEADDGAGCDLLGAICRRRRSAGKGRGCREVSSGAVPTLLRLSPTTTTTPLRPLFTGVSHPTAALQHESDYDPLVS